MATSCPSELDVDALRERIRDVYTRVAEDPSGDFHFHRGARYAVDVLGYDADELSALPRRTTDRFAGVGNPLAWAALERCLRASPFRGVPELDRVSVDDVRRWVEREGDPTWFEIAGGVEVWWFPLSGEGDAWTPSGAHVGAPLDGSACRGAIVN